jgi:hypothetical protein
LKISGFEKKISGLAISGPRKKLAMPTCGITRRQTELPATRDVAIIIMVNMSQILCIARSEGSAVKKLTSRWNVADKYYLCNGTNY